jgi:metallo-beta-lactamase class B
VAVTDGQKITVGDTTITLMITPGHTPGTLAYLIPLKDRGKPITVLMLSGANITPDRASLIAFDKALDAAKAARAQALINGHPGLFGDELGWMEQIRKSPNGPNPFLYTQDQFAKFIDIMKECAASRVVAMGK